MTKPLNSKCKSYRTTNGWWKKMKSNSFQNNTWMGDYAGKESTLTRVCTRKWNQMLTLWNKSGSIWEFLVIGLYQSVVSNVLLNVNVCFRHLACRFPFNFTLVRILSLACCMLQWNFNKHSHVSADSFFSWHEVIMGMVVITSHG